MEETIRRINTEFNFNLSDDEIRRIASQAEEVNRLLHVLFEMDMIGIMPILRFDERRLR